MATATKVKTPAKSRARAKPAEKGTLDYLELALDDLNKARAHAQHDARQRIDAAIERIRDAMNDLRRKAGLDG